MKNVFTKIKLSYVLILMLFILATYFAYNNYTLNKKVDLNNSKNCEPKNLEEVYFNISKYGTTTNPKNCGYADIRPNYNGNLLGSTTSLSDFMITSNPLNPINQESQKKIEEMRDSIIGCYYMTENVNERIKLDRNNYFSKFVEGSTRFVMVSGSYLTNLDFKGILFSPTDESNFSMKLEFATDTVKLIDKNNKVFEKQICADFYTGN